MPYLRMFVGEQQIHEVYLSETLLNSVISQHIISEEKQKLLDKHEEIFTKEGKQPNFALDTIPSVLNNFSPLRSDQT